MKDEQAGIMTLLEAAMRTECERCSEAYVDEGRFRDRVVVLRSVSGPGLHEDLHDRSNERYVELSVSERQQFFQKSGVFELGQTVRQYIFSIC